MKWGSISLMIWFLVLLTALRSGIAASSIGAIKSIFVAMASLAISGNASQARFGELGACAGGSNDIPRAILLLAGESTGFCLSEPS